MNAWLHLPRIHVSMSPASTPLPQLLDGSVDSSAAG